MDAKPSKGLKVKVNARREAIFGEESVSIQKIALTEANRSGVMTGLCVAGFCEIDMQKLGGKHWFPVGDLQGEKGEKVVEEAMAVDVPGDSEDSDEE